MSAPHATGTRRQPQKPSGHAIHTELDTYLTTGEVAARLRVRQEYVAKLCRRGDLPGAFKVGRSIRIPESAVVRYVASLEAVCS